MRALGLVETLRQRTGVRTAYSLLKRQMFTRQAEAGGYEMSGRFPEDPMVASQWHLHSRSAEPAGTNVRAVWDIIAGSGTVIGIVDNGLQHTHPDLQPNYSAALSFDFNDGDPDPSPVVTFDFHGTAVAGVAAARGGNGIGVSGAAPLATLAGLRLIAAPFSDATGASALGHEPNAIHISNNSWGPSDDGATLEGPGPMTEAAIESAATTGRGGLGRVFVWAGGNGAESDDNCNFDGFANSRFAIAVGALEDNAQQAFYSEPCAALFLTAPGGPRGLTTTDLVGANGYSSTDYTSTFGGTSAAAPVVSGIVALMLSRNPSLTARDVKHVLARTAVKLNPADLAWSGGRYSHHENLGFGLVDANAAVVQAGSWRTVLPEQAIPPVTHVVNLPIPDDISAGVQDSIVIGPAFANFRVEHVEVEFSATHTFRGDIQVDLISPAGVQSRLAIRRANDDSTAGYSAWRFRAVRHWGETAAGTWTLRVSDGFEEDTGAWNSWTLRIFGTQPTAPVGTRPASDFDGDGRSDFALYRSGIWVIENSPSQPSWGIPSDVPVIGDYDADGFADVAVYRPANGTWWVQGQAPVMWGIPGDIPVPADYDGNGSTDKAVFRPATGTWFVLGQFTRQWGIPGDIPVPGDYNGDDIADVAIYRPSEGRWYIFGGGSFVFGLPSDIPVPADFNGDGQIDIAVFRPSTATWLVMGQFTRQWGAIGDLPLAIDINADGRAELVAWRREDGVFRIHDELTMTQLIRPFGAPGDVPALVSPWLTVVRAGDFDGDRRADPTVFHPPTGEWRTRRSGDGTEGSTAFGLSDDIPVPGNYLGFGRNQLAVFRPSDLTWRIAGGPTVVWGDPGGVLGPADYDGDSRTDLAFWRPSDGVWFLRQSSSPDAALFWGVPGDIPVPGDYDGDRRADPAVYRPSAGVWYVLRSSTNYTTYFAISWGVAGDRPVPGDYDGDGRMDIAVWRPSSGVWFRLLSSTNYTSASTVGWGLPDDIPVVADYNGDGKTDVTMFRPASGTWFVFGGPTVSLGMSGDIPLPRTP